jgi:NTE family protein
MTELPRALKGKATATPVKTKPLNLALQGGGAHGAFAWGVLDKLIEDGRIEIDGLSATSAGAMNAAVYAYGKMVGGPVGAREHLDRFWAAISEAGAVASPIRRTPMDDMLKAFGLADGMSYHLFDAITRTFSPYQFNPFNLNPLRDVLERIVDFDALKRCTCTKLRLCATNVRSGKARIFTNAEMSADIVLASACLPMLFQAVEIDGEAYWDGGYIGNPAIYPLIYDTETPDVLIVHINPIERPDVPKTAPEISNRINEISFNSSLMREMRAIAFVTKLIDDGWLKDEAVGKLRRMYLHAIRTDETMSGFSVASKFEVDRAFLDRLKTLGRQAAKAWLEAHFDRIGKESSVDIRQAYL